MKGLGQQETELLRTVLGLVLEYLERGDDGQEPVGTQPDVQALRDAISWRLPERGVSNSALVDVVRDYLGFSVRTGSPRFLNQLFSGFDLAGFLGDVVVSATNTSMATYEIAPVATLIERELIEVMGRMVGFESGEGLMVPGGSNANMLGMLCARHRIAPEAAEEGLSGPPLVAFVSAEAHYSFAKGALLLGLGARNLVAVECDDRGRMRPAALERAIKLARAEGKRPFFVGATAGTTVLGAFDPLPEIADICRRTGLWLHVDGAWGGPALFSRKHRHLLEGAELADTFAWDAHKLMGVPLLCTALLVREPGVLSRSCGSGGTDYIFHEGANLDLGPVSLQCGRRVDSLKLWLAWKHHGRRGYEERVDALMELANHAARQAEARDGLELAIEPDFLNVCLRVTPPGFDKLTPTEQDEFTVAVRERLVEEGHIFTNYATVHGRKVIRLVLANPAIDEAVVDDVLDSLLAAASVQVASVPARGGNGHEGTGCSLSS